MSCRLYVLPALCPAGFMPCRLYALLALCLGGSMSCVVMPLRWHPWDAPYAGCIRRGQGIALRKNFGNWYHANHLFGTMDVNN